MKNQVKAIPEGFHTVTPTLMLKNSLEAIEFYKKAFGARQMEVFPSPNGKGTMHASIKIGDSMLMMGDEMPNQSCKSAESLGSSPINFYIYVSNVDTFFKQAIGAGAKVMMPVEEMFWGDRCGTLKDPFGYMWTIATHTRDLTEKEMQEGAQSFFAKAGKP